MVSVLTMGLSGGLSCCWGAMLYKQAFFYTSLAICCPYADSSLLLDPGYTELDKSKSLNNDSKMFPGSYCTSKKLVY